MNNDKTIKHLPCRGCTADCIYYSECDGRLWRLAEIRKKNQLKPAVNQAVEKGSKS